jgi:hypothetical protein
MRHSLNNMPFRLRPLLSACVVCFIWIHASNCNSIAVAVPRSYSAQDDAVTAVNKLAAGANDDLNELDNIWDKQEKQVDKLKKADIEGDSVIIKSLLKELIEMLDEARQFGQSAVAKLEQAVKLNVNDEYKIYLRLKTQAVRKQLEALMERQDAARLMRYNYGGADKERESRIKDEFKKKSENYKRLLREAKELGHQADEIARRNPDKIPQSPKPDKP